MAQTLTEDRPYNLTEDENLDRRHVYFVKLTDSCLKAIEEFIIHKASAKSQPKIKFVGQNGIISIPGKSCNGDSNGKKFHFGVSSLNQGNSQGAVECIKHPDRKSNSLVSLGPLESKISINATEDVYENTRNRMAQVDAERKDVRTREIELKTTKKRKQAKSKILTPEPNKHTNISTAKKKLTSHQSSPSQSVSSTSRLSPAPGLVTSRTVPAASGKSFTCRERVIHILAIRPHKKPELIQRLTREAMSQKDRNNLAMVLQQVSSSHDNQYKLHGHLYNDIQVNTWPFYNEHERNIVKKKIEEQKLLSKHTSPPQQVSSTSKSPEEKGKVDDKHAVKRPLSALDNGISAKRHKQASQDDNEPHSTVSSSKPIKNEESPIKMPPSAKQPSTTTKSKQGKDGVESPPTVASTSKTPEYLKNYKPITWNEQRRQYKLDFESEYPIYLKLKESVDAVRTKFQQLQQEYNNTERGTPEHKKIEMKIVEAYDKLNNEKYHEQRRKYEELEQKLRYIKKLVVEYDNNVIASCE